MIGHIAISIHIIGEFAKKLRRWKIIFLVFDFTGDW